VGIVRTAASAVAAGHVISQDPARGQKLKQHGRVDLVVSSG
jgi:beta-lactam-binding protein with PASTA domain